MKKKMIATIVVLLSATAYAKTDVPGAMGQLKVNEENAKANRKSYEDNVEIATKNIVEVTAAVKQLRDQRAQLNGNAQNLDKNLAALDAMKTKLEGFKQDEITAQKKEELQIAQLKAVLDKLEANKVKRQENIAAYDAKVTEVATERADGAGQRQTLTSIQTELDAKEATALKEREQWIAKRKEYRDESANWDKESKVAEEQRVKYEKLKD